MYVRFLGMDYHAPVVHSPLSSRFLIIEETRPFVPVDWSDACILTVDQHVPLPPCPR